MLVDDLEGTVHHAYGRLPNMTYIVNAGGTIVYRAAWTDPRTIRSALEQIVFERGERRAKRRITPYYMESQPQRPNDDVTFVQESLRARGARPVDEFIAAMDDVEGPARDEAPEGVVGGSANEGWGIEVGWAWEARVLSFGFAHFALNRPGRRRQPPIWAAPSAAGPRTSPSHPSLPPPPRLRRTHRSFVSEGGSGPAPAGGRGGIGNKSLLGANFSRR